jgi:hypothetical protein
MEAEAYGAQYAFLVAEGQPVGRGAWADAERAARVKVQSAVAERAAAEKACTAH